MMVYDIVRAIKKFIPFYTDQLTDTFDIVSFSFNQQDKKYIIQTSPVPIGSLIPQISSTNDELTISDVILKNPVVDVTYKDQTQSAIIEFQNDHFLTLNVGCERFYNKNYKYFKSILSMDSIVLIEGASNQEWNGEFVVCDVITSKKIEIVFFNEPSIKNPIIDFYQSEKDNPLFNFTDKINFISQDNFEIPILSEIEPFDGWIIDGESAKILANHRITGALNIEVANLAYTKKPKDILYIFVTKGDSSGESTFASQARNISLDSTDVRTQNVFYTQNIVERFTINLFIPSTYYIAGRQSIDIAEIFKPILFKSILGVRFPSIFKSGMEGYVTYIRDAPQLYNNAYYVHSYYFERVDSINISDCIDREYIYPIEFINLNYIGQKNGNIILTDNIDIREN